MAAEPQQPPSNSLTVRDDQMLFAIPVDEGGVEETLFTTDGTQVANAEPINLAGVWSHLDWDAAQDFFDQIDRESVPSAPLQADDL